MRLKLIIGLWISLIILASCEERADYLNWSRKVANYCRYVKFSEESKRYECGPKLGEFYTYIIVHPDYDLPKNPIYPLVAYDKQDNVVMVGGNGKGQIWRMIKFEIWAFVRETKTGMKEVYYDEEEKAFIGLEMGDNKEDIKSKAWWSRDGGKSWVRARVPLFKKKKSNSVVPVSPLVGEPTAPRTPVLKPLAKAPVAPAGPKLPAGGVAEAVGGGYAVAIGEVGGKATVWRSIEKVPRDWKVTGNFHGGATSLPPSLSKPGELEGVKFEGGKFEITDTEGIEWTYEDIRNRWEISKVDFAGGDGTVGDPYQIASAIHLWLVREELNKHFKLTKDLDLSVITEEKGFDPIGDDTNQFEGTFDGKGKVIRNLRINRPAEDNVGLFEMGGVLKNIGLENVNVRGKDRVGALVGWNAGTVEASYATGTVRGKDYVGGLVGMDSSGGITKVSYANVNVSGEELVGGLIGYHNYGAAIENSYAKGDVTGTISVGGLVGKNTNQAKIIKSYATGNVTGRSGLGGFVGLISGSINIFHKNYWKSGSAAQGIGNRNATHVFKKTDAELRALDAGETGWSDKIWDFKAGEYPRLKWQTEGKRERSDDWESGA